MLVNGSHMIPNKHAAFSNGEESKSSVEGKAAVPLTLKDFWLLGVEEVEFYSGWKTLYYYEKLKWE